LQVPEINSHSIQDAKLIANPNCTTAIAAVVLYPLIKEFGIKRLIVSTYQAASGAGAEVLTRHMFHQSCITFFQSYDTLQGMDELIKGTAEKLSGGEPKASVFAHPLPFNLIPHIDSFQVCNF